MKKTNERAVGDRIGGQIILGGTGLWKATHFGYYFTMTVQITELVSPLHFSDEMIKVTRPEKTLQVFTYKSSTVSFPDNCPPKYLWYATDN